MLQDTDNLIPNNGHDALPPDYLSPVHNMMFDIMRINDTEEKKTYNPVKIRERKMLKELQQSEFLEQVNSNAKICCISEADNTEEHSFAKYHKNLARVTAEHLSSKRYTNKIKEIWTKEHPEICYKGFLIFDETECCFDGFIQPAYLNQFLFCAKEPVTLHEPWNDADFIQWAYDSDLDFIVWACIDKSNGSILMEYNIIFPHIMIIDVRYPRTKPYADYRNKHLVL